MADGPGIRLESGGQACSDGSDSEQPNQHRRTNGQPPQRHRTEPAPRGDYAEGKDDPPRRRSREDAERQGRSRDWIARAAAATGLPGPRSRANAGSTWLSPQTGGRPIGDRRARLRFPRPLSAEGVGSRPRAYSGGAAQTRRLPTTLEEAQRWTQRRRSLPLPAEPAWWAERSPANWPPVGIASRFLRADHPLPAGHSSIGRRTQLGRRGWWPPWPESTRW